MGRKPNKLILEFFERGQKLEDSSNRYQHTCKSCGEKFPKGRIDSLTTHLLKKCPAVSFNDRQRAVQQLSETPNQHGTYNPLAIAIRNEQATQQPQVEDFNFATSYPMSALETLAEVSRQQLDHNGDYVPDQANSRKRRRSSALIEANNMAMSPSMFFNEFPVEAQTDAAPRLFDVNNQLLAGIHAFTAAHQRDSSEASRGQFTHEVPTARMVPAQQLALAASAASDMLPGPGPQHNLDPALSGGGLPGNLFQLPSKSGRTHMRMNNAIDPQLQNDGMQSMNTITLVQVGQDGQIAEGGFESSHQRNATSGDASQDDTFQGSHHEMHHLDQTGYPPFDDNVEDTSGMTGSVPKPALPQSQFMSDFNISQNASAAKNKVRGRGRFSASRRKEVQEVRKQGACVRCRMLKKPCSGGTPCTTCRQVESARLWKQPCVRTRIADEFDLYSAGLYTVLAFHATSDVKQKADALQPSTHQIEATHVLDFVVAPAVMSTVTGEITNGDIVDPELHPVTATKADHIVFELLDLDKNDVASTLDRYIKRIAPSLFQAELSTFMRPTLLLAAELTNAKLDPLLNKALELWTATQILVDPALQWHLFSTEYAIFLPDDQNNRQQISQDTDALTHRLITCQLLDLTEKRAAAYAKALMTDLERRLLQRQAAAGQNFETFLVAIILLNCVERMCWHFGLWSVSQNAQSGEDGTEENGQAQDLPNWPLEKSPDGYVAKGEGIADVLAMLLRMRGVPPQMYMGEDGNVHERPSLQQSASMMGPGPLYAPTTSLAPLDNAALDPSLSSLSEMLPQPQQSVVAAWLESVQLSAETIAVVQTAGTWDRQNCRSWDMRWISRLFMLTGQR